MTCHRAYIDDTGIQRVVRFVSLCPACTRVTQCHISQLQTNVESLWFASGFSGNFYPHTLVYAVQPQSYCQGFWTHLYSHTRFGDALFLYCPLTRFLWQFGADSPTRTDNRLITNQLRYRLRHICNYNWSEGRESNPQMLAWKARAKPLGYPRIKELNSEFWKKIIKEYTRTQK